MQLLLKQLETALELHLGTLPTISLVKDGVYRVIMPEQHTHLLVYDDFVSERLDTPGSQPYIHLDKDILQQNFEKVISRIAAIFGRGEKLHARQTVVARVDKQVAMAFQHEHHLQVALPGKYRYGLFYEGELVSLAVFSGGRKMNNRPHDYRSFELLRFCHKSRFLVVGGLSKLIRRFQKEVDPGDIMTYVDRDWSQDSALKSIGFVETSNTSPQKYVLKQGKRSLIPKHETHHDILSDSIHGETWIKSNSGSIKMVLPLKNPT